MKQRFINGSFIYSQFTNLIFDPLPPNNEKIIRISTLIEDHKNHTFNIFMNNHNNLAIIYNTFFNFLHEDYFFKYIFESMYLSKLKISIFAINLEMLKFQNNTKNLKSFIKYREKIRD